MLSLSPASAKVKKAQLTTLQQGFSPAVGITCRRIEENSIKEIVTALLQVEKTRLWEEKLNAGVSEPKTNDNESELKNILSCTLCDELFDQPATLVCGHTFCMKCLNCYGQDRVVCPICHFTSSEGYSLNFVVRELVRGNFEEEINLRECISVAEKKLNEGNLSESMNQIQQLLQEYPGKNLNLLCLRAKVFLRSGLQERALYELETVCKLNPFHIKPFLHRGKLLFNVGDYGQAVNMFLRAAALKPDNVVFTEQLTMCVRQMFSTTFPAQTQGSENAFLRSDFEAPISQTVASTAPQTLKKNSAAESSCDRKLDCSSVKDTRRAKEITADELECKLCLNMIYKPVTTPCGHTFCRDCLSRCLDHRYECPCCRANLQGYLELITKGQNGVCETIENVLHQQFQIGYNARKLAREKELRNFVRSEGNNTAVIPIFVCTLAVPNIPCPLHIFEPKFKLMIRRCLESGTRIFGMCVPDPEHEFALVGTVLEIINVEFLPDGRSILQTVGGRRFKVLSKHKQDGYNVAKVEWLTDEHDAYYLDYTALVTEVYHLTLSWFSNLPVKHQDCVVQALGEIPSKEASTSANSFKWLWWLVAALPLNVEAKLIILSMTSVVDRLTSTKRFLELLLKQNSQT